MTRIGIVEDHPLFSQALQELFATLPSLKFSFVASSAEECLSLLRNHPVDLLLVDLQLKSMGGLDLIKQILAHGESINCVVISMHPEEIWGERALRAGAKGYISKSEPPNVILDKIRLVLKGGLAFSEGLKENILMGMSQTVKRGELYHELTDRELEVFQYLGRGLTTRKIAEKMHLSVKTVETYRERIKRRLNLDNANQLLQQASLFVARNSG